MINSTKTDGVISYRISIDGRRLLDKYQVLRIEVTKQVNRISHARIEIRDGCVSTGAFSASDSGIFSPGNTIRIAMGYRSRIKTVFRGIITKQSIGIEQQSTSVLRLECKNPAVKMTNGRHNACYFKMKDSQIIKKIASKYGIISTTQSSSFAHPQMVQYHATDWDFILTRAQANGQLVFTENGKIQVNKPRNGFSVATLSYGRNILDFNAEVSSHDQYPNISGQTWEPDKQKLLKVKATAPSLTQGGNPGKQMASDLKTKPLVLQHGASLEKEDMQAWADAYWQNSAMASISGSLATQGMAKLKPGDIITLEGLAKHLNGKVWVNSVHHQMVKGNWVSHIGFGLSGVWFGNKPDVHTPINQGLLPAIKGLQIGVVTDTDDPQNAYRVRVRLPLITDDTKGVWARLGCNYAGKEYGCFFLPEVGDEVVLGFLDNDPRSPIILSALNSKKNPPSKEGKAAKPQKYLITKNKLKLCFDDQKKVIHIETPGGCKFDLDDSKKAIMLKDPNGNELKMSNSGISLTSKKDINLSSTMGDIILSGVNVNVTAATGDFSAAGLNITQEADMNFTAKANIKTEVSASAQTIVKGGMVMIN